MALQRKIVPVFGVWLYGVFDGSEWLSALWTLVPLFGPLEDADETEEVGALVRVRPVLKLPQTDGAGLFTRAEFEQVCSLVAKNRQNLSPFYQQINLCFQLFGWSTYLSVFHSENLQKNLMSIPGVPPLWLSSPWAFWAIISNTCSISWRRRWSPHS